LLSLKITLLKRILVLCVPLFLYTNIALGDAGAARNLVNADSVEFGISGKWDLDPDDRTVSYLRLTLGYFLWDGHEIGIKSLFGVDERGYRDHKGIFYEWNWINGTEFLPYTGIDFMHAAPPDDSTDDKDSRYTSVFFGSKYMLAANAALALQYQIDYTASGNVFGPRGNRTKRNREINLSIRIYK